MQAKTRRSVVAQLREMALRMAAMLSLIDRSLVDTYSAFSKIDRDGDGCVLCV
jgi:hypothetical protein